MKTVPIAALAASVIFLADLVPVAGAAATAARSQTAAASATHALRPLAACAFGGPSNGFCAGVESYAPRAWHGRTIASPLVSAQPFGNAGRAGFAREFDASFSDRYRRMQRCLAQTPADQSAPNEAVWLWRLPYQHPLPADPDAQINLSAARLSLANYRYCMWHP